MIILLESPQRGVVRTLTTTKTTNPSKSLGNPCTGTRTLKAPTLINYFYFVCILYFLNVINNRHFCLVNVDWPLESFPYVRSLLLP